MTNVELGRIQVRIMQVLWEKKRATAREITTVLNEFEPIDHRNVQTILRRLEKKGSIGFTVEDRTHIYYPLIDNNRVKMKAISDFINQMFQGSVSNLVSALISHEHISVEELKKIFRMFEKKDK
ncbi:BlaI/MecI/CopY family transcriptional regulator [bacterium]|nr:BlaI/MecI/CopY family transcriptional regulator [bacterium]